MSLLNLIIYHQITYPFHFHTFHSLRQKNPPTHSNSSRCFSRTRLWVWLNITHLYLPFVCFEFAMRKHKRQGHCKTMQINFSFSPLKFWRILATLYHKTHKFTLRLKFPQRLCKTALSHHRVKTHTTRNPPQWLPLCKK